MTLFQEALFQSSSFSGSFLVLGLLSGIFGLPKSMYLLTLCFLWLIFF